MFATIIGSVIGFVVGAVSGGVFSYLFFRANPAKAAAVNSAVATGTAAAQTVVTAVKKV
jgi:hypothetical protein